MREHFTAFSINTNGYLISVLRAPLQVYWSIKDQAELVYYTAADLLHARVKRISNGMSAKPWSFQIAVASTNGFDFTPGEFAAESGHLRELWISEFERVSQVYS